MTSNTHHVRAFHYPQARNVGKWMDEQSHNYPEMVGKKRIVYLSNVSQGMFTGTTVWYMAPWEEVYAHEKRGSDDFSHPEWTFHNILEGIGYPLSHSLNIIKKNFEMFKTEHDLTHFLVHTDKQPDTMYLAEFSNEALVELALIL